jgi:hypothetical protein
MSKRNKGISVAWPVREIPKAGAHVLGAGSRQTIREVRGWRFLRYRNQFERSRIAAVHSQG